MVLKLIKPDAKRITRRPKLSKQSQMRQLTARYAAEAASREKHNHFKLFKPMPGVLPAGANIAMDFDDTLAGVLDFGYQNGYGEGLGFMGYSVLSELMQRPEYRRFAEIFAEEMTRKFIRIISASDEDQSFRIKLINDALDKFKLKDIFYQLAFIDCAYGRAMLYIDTGELSDAEARSPLIISKETIPLHSLVGFKAIEPMWSYPTGFNSMDPTRDDFYKPRAWYSMGKEYHASRMVPFIGRDVPDMLKPVYQFGGLSLTQMVKPYVDNWIRTRQNVGDAIEQFAQNVLKTNLESVLEGGGGEDLDARVALYNAVRSARGTMVIDKDTEDFMIASMPLGNLDKLQAQAQEQMCSVVALPLIKYLGITPSGLNASTDNELRVLFDTVAGKQALLYGPHMKMILDIIMQSELGEVNKDISYTFEALWQMSDTERATMRSTNANTAKTYIDAGVVDAEEERKRLANEEDGMYPGLDPDDLPEPPQQPGMDPFGGVGGPDDPEPGPDDAGGGQPTDPKPPVVPPGAKVKPVVAQDAEFAEHKHPRGPDGKFAKSAGIKAELHPDKFASSVTKKQLSSLHEQVDMAHALEGDSKKVALKTLRKVIPSRYGAKVHKYLDQLIEEHGASEHEADGSVTLKTLNSWLQEQKGKGVAVPKEVEKVVEATPGVNPDTGEIVDTAAFNKWAEKNEPESVIKDEPAKAEEVPTNFTDAQKESYKAYIDAGVSHKEALEYMADYFEEPEAEHPLLNEAANHYMALKNEGYTHVESMSQLSQNHKDALKGVGSQAIEDKADEGILDDPDEKTNEPASIYDVTHEQAFKMYSTLADEHGKATGFELLTPQEKTALTDDAIKDYKENLSDGLAPFDAFKNLSGPQQDIWEAAGLDPNNLEASKPASAPKQEPAFADEFSDVPTTLNGLTKVGTQLGSNPGGTYTDAKGNKFYVKHSKSDDHAKNEVLAGKLYQLAGAPVLAPSLIDVGDGKLGTITPWVAHEGQFDHVLDDHKAEVAKHFATHAWTGNWDAIGLGYDNQVKMNGKFHTVDVGGALKYRAQGQAKKDDDFNGEVKEVDSLLSKSKNAQSYNAFSGITTKQKKESAQAIADIPNQKIADAIVSVYGANVESAMLLQKLVKRKENIAMQLGADTTSKAAVSKVSPAAKSMEKSIIDNLPNVLEKNKPIIQSKMDEINAALKSSDPVQALKDTNSISGSSASKNAVNAYLDKLKEDHGAKPVPPPPPSPGAAPVPHITNSSPKSIEIYHQVLASPPKKVNDTFDVRHIDGQKLKAKLDIDTTSIPANWHAAVTGALEGDHEHGGKAENYSSINELMDKYYSQVTQKVATPAEQNTLSSYKGSGYTPINDALLDPPPSPAIKTKINQLKALIAKSPIPADLPVWRGMRCSLEGLVGHPVGDLNELVGKGFVHKNFASVSRKESVSAGFARANWDSGQPHVMLKFTAPAGSKGVLTSGQSGEAEIVMDAGSMFRIDKVEAGHGFKGKGHLLHVTYLGQKE